jgi:hypothetical protein
MSRFYATRFVYFSPLIPPSDVALAVTYIPVFPLLQFLNCVSLLPLARGYIECLLTIVYRGIEPTQVRLKQSLTPLPALLAFVARLKPPLESHKAARYCSQLQE